jgi:purine-binding chemotaxis protein CheW
MMSPERSTPPPSAPILTFSLGQQQYALPVDEVVEVAAMVELVAVPGAPPEVLGVANRHGAVLPILDLRRAFGMPPAAITPSTLFIVAVHHRRIIGLLVDEVHQVEYISQHQLHHSPTSGNAIRGIISHHDRLIQVIAIAPLITAYLNSHIADVTIPS